ncbi:MAG: hypothetical protein M0027_15275 [Candidatus Dormibacteraeota bacterium]|nr:hypothetical protein [Candidatus Dormibacteraeota bacterium]
MLVHDDSIPGGSAKLGDQLERAARSEPTAWILTRVTNNDSVYGTLGTHTSTDDVMEKLKGRPIASATEP